LVSVAIGVWFSLSPDAYPEAGGVFSFVAGGAREPEMRRFSVLGALNHIGSVFRRWGFEVLKQPQLGIVERFGNYLAHVRADPRVSEIAPWEIADPFWLAAVRRRAELARISLGPSDM
jgi:hypothetical protein